MSSVRWIDLSKIGVVLGRVDTQEGRRVLAAVDGNGSNGAGLEALGFQPEPGGAGLWRMQPSSSPISPRRIAEVFGAPAVKEITVDEDDLAAQYRNAREFALHQAARRARNSAMEAKPVGVNHAGLQVFSGADGVRFFKMQQAGQEFVVKETDLTQAGGTRRESMGAAFLRVTQIEDLPKIADGFVARALRGARLGRSDFSELVDVSGVVEAGLSRYDLQDAVEGSVSRAFARNLKKNEDPEYRYKLALRLYEAMPKHQERTSNSVANQQFSTPWPIAYLAQRLLGDVQGKSVLEPTIGNRSLVTALPEDVSVFGVEIDNKRLSYFGEGVSSGAAVVLLGDATKADFQSMFGQPDGFDVTIANPPFGSLPNATRVAVDSPLVEAIETKRLDHLILLRTLAARKDVGQSVFIVGADHALDDGAIKGRSKWLLNYLNDHYQVDGMVDISGKLYQRMGSGYPIRMLVVGDKRAQPEHVADLPEALPVLRSHEEVKDWVEAVLSARTEVQAQAKIAASVVVEESVDAGKAGPDTLPSPDVVQTPAPTEPEPETKSEPMAGVETKSEASVEEVLAGASVEADVQMIEDDFQRAYEPFSRVGEATTMIPVNLAGPVYEALAKVETRHGSVDGFVASQLEYSPKELGDYFSPEQVDALALAISAKSDGKGFLLADRMGVGKGRTLAALARHARLQGETPVFVTHKANLFSDFLERDLVDINSRHLFKSPFIFNAGARIVDKEGKVTARAPKPQEFNRCYESGQLPEGTDIVFMTYSQIAREELKSKRSKLFLDMGEKDDLAFLLDESHNGAGDSHTSDNLCKVIGGDKGSVIYSSGTPIKGAKNLRLYSRVLPRGMDYEELLAVVQKDPISMQEALNHEIALSGCLISRELDDTEVIKEYAKSTHTERNIGLSDQVSEILTAMSYLSGDVENIVDERKLEIKEILKQLPEEDRKGSRMGVSSMNFGSRFHAISRQFLLALKADDCVEEAVAAIERGEKPIIALQHTGESLVAAALADKRDAMLDSEHEGEVPALRKGGVKLNKPITFKDLMYRYVDKIMTIKEVGHYGQVTVRQVSSEESQKTISHIASLIEKLPDSLTLTPIDYFKDQMQKRGYKVGEISGRSLEVSYDSEGGIVVSTVNNSDKTKVNKVCREFNNGDTDAVVLTASGSTGLSLQAAPANGPDLRPRRMLKWEPQQDIAVERQIDGRHNRTGQVVAPRYTVLLSGLPADDRQAMMFNNKNRSLTSATVANRDSKDLIDSVPDLLNEVGDYVAAQMFLEDPRLAAMMDVELGEEGGAESNDDRRSDNFYINRMTGRIMLLPYEKQVALYAELGRRFNERIDELSARGENPLQVKCYDWKAKVVDREIFVGEEVDGDKKSQSQFDEPVYLTTISYDKEMKPLRSAEVDKRIGLGMEIHREHALVGESGSMEEIRQIIRAGYNDWLEASVSVFKFKSGTVQEALAHKEPNETKNLQAKLSWLLDRVGYIIPGSIFHLEQESGEVDPYVIVGVTIPSPDDFKRLGTWGVMAVRPGFDQVEHFTLNSLYTRNARVTGSSFEHNKDVRRKFDECPDGVVKAVQHVLDGNIFEAVATSMRHKIGRKIVYTDEEGIRQHAVLVRSGITPQKLKQSVAEKMRDPIEIMWYLDKLQQKKLGYMGLSSDPEGKYEPGSSVRVSKTEAGDYVLTVPGTKAAGGHVFLDPHIAKIDGKSKADGLGLHFDGTRAAMRAYIKPRQMADVLAYVVDRKSISFYTTDRDMLAEVRKEVKEYKTQRLACAEATGAVQETSP